MMASKTKKANRPSRASGPALADFVAVDTATKDNANAASAPLAIDEMMTTKPEAGIFHLPGGETAAYFSSFNAAKAGVVTRNGAP